MGDVHRAATAAPNIQFPAAGTACAPNIMLVDPKLGLLADNGGPTKTMLPMAGSPAIGIGTGCPMIDQRGNMRGVACTLGAVEVP